MRALNKWKWCDDVTADVRHATFRDAHAPADATIVLTQANHQPLAHGTVVQDNGGIACVRVVTLVDNVVQQQITVAVLLSLMCNAEMRVFNSLHIEANTDVSGVVACLRPALTFNSSANAWVLSATTLARRVADAIAGLNRADAMDALNLSADVDWATIVRVLLGHGNIADAVHVVTLREDIGLFELVVQTMVEERQWTWWAVVREQVKAWENPLVTMGALTSLTQANGQWALVYTCLAADGVRNHWSWWRPPHPALDNVVLFPVLLEVAGNGDERVHVSRSQCAAIDYDNVAEMLTCLQLAAYVPLCRFLRACAFVAGDLVCMLSSIRAICHASKSRSLTPPVSPQEWRAVFATCLQNLSEATPRKYVNDLFDTFVQLTIPVGDVDGVHKLCQVYVESGVPLRVRPQWLQAQSVEQRLHVPLETLCDFCIGAVHAEHGSAIINFLCAVDGAYVDEFGDAFARVTNLAILKTLLTEVAVLPRVIRPDLVHILVDGMVHTVRKWTPKCAALFGLLCAFDTRCSTNAVPLTVIRVVERVGIANVVQTLMQHLETNPLFYRAALLLLSLFPNDGIPITLFNPEVRQVVVMLLTELFINTEAVVNAPMAMEVRSTALSDPSTYYLLVHHFHQYDPWQWGQVYQTQAEHVSYYVDAGVSMTLLRRSAYFVVCHGYESAATTVTQWFSPWFDGAEVLALAAPFVDVDTVPWNAVAHHLIHCAERDRKFKYEWLPVPWRERILTACFNVTFIPAVIAFFATTDQLNRFDSGMPLTVRALGLSPELATAFVARLRDQFPDDEGTVRTHVRDVLQKLIGKTVVNDPWPLLLPVLTPAQQAALLEQRRVAERRRPPASRRNHPTIARSL